MNYNPIFDNSYLTWTTTTSTGNPNTYTYYNYGSIDNARLDETEIQKRAEKIAKDMLIEELKEQYRVTHRGGGSGDYGYYRNTLVERNNRKVVIISAGYINGCVHTRSYEAKYDGMTWVADEYREILKYDWAASDFGADLNHDKRVSEIIELLGKDEETE